MSQDNCSWPSYYDEYGSAVEGDPRPLPIRCGILVAGDDEYDCVIALAIGDEAPVAISREVAERLRENLRTAVKEQETVRRRGEEQRVQAARQLIGCAVLTRERWRAVMEDVASAGNEQLRRALETLTACAPPAWRDDADDRRGAPG